MQWPLHPIGYQGVDVRALIQALEKQRAKRLGDVRAVPMSRKKGFSKHVLARTRVGNREVLDVRARKS